MDKQISVIVTRCVKKTSAGEARIFGDRLLEIKVFCIEEAMVQGNLHLADGRAVLVRPNYNEKDEKGHFFREWRSFNGEPLKETRFNLHHPPCDFGKVGIICSR